MAVKFSYEGDPSKSTRDAVRFFLGDISSRRPLLDDREIDFAITKHPNELIAAAICAETLQGKFSAEADVSVGDVSKSFSSIAAAFESKAIQLRREAGKRIRPFAGGLSISEKRTANQDTDAVQPSFRVGLFDDRFAVQINDAIADLRTFNGF